MRSVDRLTRNSVSPEIKRKFIVRRNEHIGKPGKKFDIGSLSAEEQKQAKDISEAAAALFVKGVLHRYNPRTYPVSTSASPPEVHMANIISTMDERQFRDVASRLKSTLRSPEKKKRLLGSQNQIDFRKAGMTFVGTTVEPRLAAPLPVLPRVSLWMPIPATVDEPPPPSEIPYSAPPTTTTAPAPAYNRLTLVVAQVRCIDETDPEGGADEIVFGGAKVEANGGLGVLTGYSFGEFDHDGVANDFGNLPLAQYDLNSTAGYPKLFFAVCYLVESDQDEAEAVKKIGDAVQLAIPAIAAFSAGAGVIAGAALNFLTAMVSAFIDDDPFPPYGILLTLNSPMDFGGPESYWLDTDHITGQGGAYVITYKWILSA